MQYPIIEIDLKKMKFNASKIAKLCSSKGIEIVGITKSFCGHPEIAKALVEGGVDILGDSRINNIKRYKELKVKKMLVRIPMISQVDEVVELCDISLNSEIKTIRGLSNAAMKKGKVHKVILMFDVGDLREGFFDEELFIKSVDEINKLKGVELIGIGTNVGCFSGVIPSSVNMERLIKIKEKINDKYNINLQIVSVGNSSILHLMEKNKMPVEINQIRIGAAIGLGIGLNDEKIEGFCHDAYKLKAEIVEIKEKPSVPIGEVGLDAFGNIPIFEDRGIRKRAICALGKQDVDFHKIIPENDEIAILGGSSDHLILDITDCKEPLDIGDIVTFNLTYVGVLNAMTSAHVDKIFV